MQPLKKELSPHDPQSGKTDNAEPRQFEDNVDHGDVREWDDFSGKGPGLV